jgi:ubiquinone/menaquinone biosynthesis C-methylase UbiE
VSAGDDRLLDGAALAAGDDVLVLGAPPEVVFAAHARVGDGGWVYAVDSRVDALEELLDAAHARGVTGLAYLVGEPGLLPLPDASVAAAVVADADVSVAARELFRVLRPGGRLALAGSPDAADALSEAGFVDVVAGDAVTARSPG